MDIEVNKIALYIGFIIWMFYSYFAISKEILAKNRIKTSYLEYARKNIFKVLRIDKLILVLVFLFYTTFKNNSVSIYLFDIMILYFFINLMYEEIKMKKINFGKEIYYYISLLVICLLPLVYYFLKGEIIITLSIIMVIMYIIPLLFLVVNNILKR